MSGTRTIYIYSDGALQRLQRHTTRLMLDLVGAESVASISRYPPLFELDEEDVAGERLANYISCEQAIGFIEPGWTYYIQTINAAAYLPIREAIVSRIPPSINVNYGPVGVGICIGPSLICSFFEHEDSPVISRANWSICLFGDGVPVNWQECRRRIGELPELHEFLDRVRAALGPCEWGVFWEV